ncbi:MAG: VOC family protein [Pseudomonadota bacterium]
MTQTLTFITIGSRDLARSTVFYADAFGWTPQFENPKIRMYQMAGFILSVFDWEGLEADMGRTGLTTPGAVTLARNVATDAQVQPLMDRMLRTGGTLLRPADVPPHGGLRGYVADPDGHPWEIAHHPALIPAADGTLTLEA